MMHEPDSPNNSGSLAFDLPGERQRATLSLAPLIDVTFILLIFFMLVSQFTRLSPIDVSLSSTSTKINTNTEITANTGEQLKAVLQLHVNGAFMINGKHHQAELGLPGAIDILKNYFDEQNKNAPTTDNEKQLVLLEPDPGVTLQQLIDAMTMLKKTPAFSVNIVMSPFYQQ